MDGQCTITINGKTVNLAFNRYAIEQGNSIKGNSSLYKNIVGQVWGGIQGYCFQYQIDSPVTFADVMTWVDETDLSGDTGKEFEKITEAFQTSMIYKKLMTKPDETAKQDEELTEEKKSSDLTKSDSFLRAS